MPPRLIIIDRDPGDENDSKKPDYRTSEEEMRDWNEHVAGPRLAEDSKLHSELVRCIERGIRATGTTDDGERIRYEARAALRDLEEQYKALEAENLRLAGEIAVFPQPVYDPSERERADRLEEQLEKVVADERAQGEEVERLHEQLETLRSAALAVVESTSYIGRDGKVVRADVALGERVRVLADVLSNPAKRPTDA